MVTEFACKDVFSEADATRLHSYFRARVAEQAGAAGAPGQDDRPAQVQASKLRQLITLGPACGNEGVQLIRRGENLLLFLETSPGRSRACLGQGHRASWKFAF